MQDNQNILTIAAPNTDTRSARGADVFFTTKYPFMKLDTTNEVSFQTISVLFNSEPPQPPAFSYTNTLIYSFAHGYDYVPSVWLTWQNPSPSFPAPPPDNSSNITYYAFGDDSGSIILAGDFAGQTLGSSALGQVAVTNYTLSGITQATTDAYLAVYADEQNVYLSLLKENIAVINPGSIVPPVNVQGVSLNIRCYVFVEDVGI
jgi:hypothetical protein